MKLIVAFDENMVIGYEDQLPWSDPDELKHFSIITKGSTLVMGRKTAEVMPKLRGRDIICLTRNKEIDTSKWKNNVTILDYFPAEDEDDNTFIAGGADIYRQSLEKKNYITEVHLSIMKGAHSGDVMFEREWLSNFVVVEKVDHETFVYYKMELTHDGEVQYTNLLRSILSNGSFRDSRNGVTIATFGNHFKFDLRNGYPLLTTKKMFLRGIIEELLFFLRGDTNSKLLENKKVNIWKGNTSREFLDSLGMEDREEGVMGPIYGYQWRHFNAEYDEKNARPAEEGIDQFKQVIDLIINDPHSRRIFMTDYNPAQVSQCVLPPCHSIVAQFFVEGKELDMFCYNRSQDTFLGTPFNIASSSLLLMIVSELTGKTPRYLHMSMGDTHIYTDHIEAVNKQIKRIPYKFPHLTIPTINSIEDIFDLDASHFVLEDYNSHKAIKVEMIA